MDVHVIYDGTLDVWREPGTANFTWVLNRGPFVQDETPGVIALQEGDVLIVFKPDGDVFLEDTIRPNRTAWWEPLGEQDNIVFALVAYLWRHLPLRAQVWFYPYLRGVRTHGIFGASGSSREKYRRIGWTCLSGRAGNPWKRKCCVRSKRRHSRHFYEWRLFCIKSSPPMGLGEGSTSAADKRRFTVACEAAIGIASGGSQTKKPCS